MGRSKQQLESGTSRAEDMSRKQGTQEKASSGETSNPQATRETVESIVVAVILAFLFRAFVAEAFVIPTGSMAPTLQGRHLDLDCVQCGYRYRTGASIENDTPQLVVQVTCPICRYQTDVDRQPRRALLKTNQDSFNGDRILVSKFAYEVADPERWDVIVFKYPGNAKQNYIKRVVGLAGETVRIQNGDIYIAPPDQRQPNLEQRAFEIARKPPAKVKAMLQLVDDTKYIAKQLVEAGWPSRWNQGVATEEQHRWQIGAGNRLFSVSAGEQVSWLRYRHLVPWTEDWDDIKQGHLPPRLVSGEYVGQLITDYYAYNDFDTRDGGYLSDGVTASSVGSCWVGDLAVACELELQSDEGELLLDLVEGGVHYTCRIDVATGEAVLTIPAADAGNTDRPSGDTGIRGSGRHRLQFANVDDQLLLWVDSKLVQFDGPTTYAGDLTRPPVMTSDDDLGDLAPIGIGGRNVTMRVTRLQVLRDIYYQAAAEDDRHEGKLEYGHAYPASQLRRMLADPEAWPALFAHRRSLYFPLEEDQFFPLGDNSPQSKDARLWSQGGQIPEYVERRLLLGKALVIYWPHAWRPLLPNFARMGFIR